MVRAELEKLLTKLVSIQSVCESEGTKLPRFIANYLRKNGAKVKLIPTSKNRVNVYAEIGKGKPTVLLLNHMDTVPVYPGWKKDPKGNKIGNKFYGLGSADMKAGIAISILLMKKLKNKFKGKIKLAVTVDEEGICEGVDTLIRKGLLRADICLVPEPTGVFLGNDKIQVGASGYYSLDIKFKGTLTSIFTNKKRNNAIYQASKFVANLDKLKLPKNKRFGESRADVLSIKGGDLHLTTTPKECVLRLTRTTVVGEDKNSIMKGVKNLLKKLKLKAEVKFINRKTPFSQGYQIDLKNPFVKKFFLTVRKELGSAKPSYLLAPGDFCHIATRVGVPPLVFGPGGTNIHAPDEWVDLKSCEKVFDIYLDFIKSL